MKMIHTVGLVLVSGSIAVWLLSRCIEAEKKQYNDNVPILAFELERQTSREAKFAVPRAARYVVEVTQPNCKAEEAVGKESLNESRIAININYGDDRTKIGDSSSTSQISQVFPCMLAYYVADLIPAVDYKLEIANGMARSVTVTLDLAAHEKKDHAFATEVKWLTFWTYIALLFIVAVVGTVARRKAKRNPGTP